VEGFHPIGETNSFFVSRQCTIKAVQKENNMSVSQDQMAQAALEIAALHAPQSIGNEPDGGVRPQTKASKGSKRQSRRGLLRKGLGVAAATLGAGALLEMGTGTSHAMVHPDDNIGNFLSSNASIPAVYGENSNTSGTGVYGKSDDYGYGVYGWSLSGEGVGGHCEYKHGVTGSSNSTDPAYAGVSGTNTGVGPAIIANGSYGSGPALRIIGHIQVQGDAVGTATLPLNAGSVTVNSPAVDTGSLILVTPAGKLNKPWWVVAGSGSFTFNTTGNHPAVNFSYLVIN
jgi:hypothetical protein